MAEDKAEGVVTEAAPAHPLITLGESVLDALPPGAVQALYYGNVVGVLKVDDDGRRLIRAAVEYFLLARDGDDDLASPDGLDDDDAVVAALVADRARLAHQMASTTVAIPMPPPT